MVFTTLLSLSIKITSIAKRIKNVCMELHGLINRAWPCGKLFLPKSPLTRENGVSATNNSSAKIIFLVLLNSCIFYWVGN